MPTIACVLMLSTLLTQVGTDPECKMPVVARSPGKSEMVKKSKMVHTEPDAAGIPDADPDTLQVVVIAKGDDRPSRVTADGQVIYMRTEDVYGACGTTFFRLMDKSFEIRLRLAKGGAAPSVQTENALRLGLGGIVYHPAHPLRGTGLAQVLGFLEITMFRRNKNLTFLFILLCATAHGAEPTFSEKERQAILSMDVSSLTNLAESGNAYAQNELGRRFGVGQGIELDSKKSFEWYKKASDQGLSIGQANLAYMYFAGEGVEQDYGKSMALAQKVAATGQPKAQNFIGYLYVMGLGVKQDGHEAERWFLLAAKQGNVEAQGALAQLYSDGKLMSPRPEAVLWLHRARDDGPSGQIWRED